MAEDLMASFEKQLESANVPSESFTGTLPEEALTSPEIANQEQDLVKSFEEQLEGTQEPKQEKQTTQQFQSSTASLLGLKPTELRTGAPEFKEALRGLRPAIEEPTVLGAVVETGKTFVEAGKNIPSSALKLGKDIFTAISSPIDTAKSIGGLATGIVQKLIPGEQESEKFVDALVDDYAERFGSLEKARQTFIEDPVGFLSDTSALLLGGGAAIKAGGKLSKIQKLAEAGELITKAGVSVDPLLQVSKLGKPVAKGLVISAEKGIEKVLAPTKEVTKAKTTKILPQLTQEKFLALSKEGLKKQVQERLKAVGSQFDELISEKGIQGATKTSVFVDALEKAKNQFKVGEKIIEETPIKVLDGLQNTLKQFGDEIPNSDLRSVRQIWDKTIAKGKRFDVQKTAEAVDELDFKKIVTDSIREELAKTNPELAVLNKKFTFYKNVDDVLFETIRRGKGQAGGLGKKLGFVAGLATGEGVMGKLVNATALSTFVKTIESTAWRTVSSALKLKLSDALTTGNKALIADVLRQIEKTKED